MNRSTSRRWGVALLLASATLVAGVRPAAAAPGSLDAGFSGDGRLTANPSGGADPAFDVTVQDDGKIVVVGRTDGGGGQFLVSRFTAAGAPDTSFDGDGRTVVDFTAGDDVAFTVGIQETGEIVVGGEAGGQLAFARLTTSGVLDSSFDGDGMLLLNPSPGRDAVKDLVIGEDSVIVASATIRNRTGAVRLSPNGVPDIGFSGDGVAVTDYPSGAEYIGDVAEQANGAVVVVGVVDGPPPAAQRTTVTRFDAGGQLDPSFSGDGRLSFNQFRGYEDATAVAVQPNGKIVVGGEMIGRFSLLRFTPAGALDTTFRGGGRVFTDLPGGNEWISALALQPNGKIVVGGHIEQGGGSAVVARYTARGALDTTFSGDGWAATNFSPVNDLVMGLELQPNGRGVSVGPSHDFARYFVQRHHLT